MIGEDSGSTESIGIGLVWRTQGMTGVPPEGGQGFPQRPDMQRENSRCTGLAGEVVDDGLGGH